MDIAETLLTVAQVAMGLAGFSSVLVALSGEPSKWSSVDSFRISGMLSASLAALFLALAPFLLHFFGVDTALVWRWSSGLVAGFLFLRVAWTVRIYHRLPRTDQIVLGTVLIATIQTILCLLALTEAGAAVGLIGPPEGVYLLGVVSLLGWATFLIVRFLFARPAV